ncbi:MAG: hypothetical protein ABF337_04000 [Akkermansiaceae bacterium]
MKTILLLFTFLSFALAQEADQQALIERLFEERESQAFEAAYLAASTAGVKQQTLIEARFLYLVDLNDFKQLGNFSKVLVEQKANFNIDDSLVFAVPEDYFAIVEYSQAVAALNKKDKQGFKKHITEAFWLSPAQAGIFGRLVDEERMHETMKKLVIDLSRQLPAQLPNSKNGKTQSLTKHLGDAKAMVLHFWSPWARESVESMNDFYTTAALLEKNKFPIASVLLSGAPESRQDADAFVKENAAKTKAPWLIDFPQNTLGSRLRIQAFPTIVILSNKGKILFNGHPAQEEFWEQLQVIDPKIKRPEAPQVEQLLPNTRSQGEEK